MRKDTYWVKKTLIGLLKDCPQNQTIGDNLVKAWSKINSNKYSKILCSISGGSDSDIMLDICERCDKEGKVEYIWFNTGLEYQATKDHLKYLEKKYNITIEEKRAKNQFQFAVQNMDSHFYQSKSANIFPDYKNIIFNGKTKNLILCWRNIRSVKLL